MVGKRVCQTNDMYIDLDLFLQKKSWLQQVTSNGMIPDNPTPTPCGAFKSVERSLPQVLTSSLFLALALQDFWVTWRDGLEYPVI